MRSERTRAATPCLGPYPVGVTAANTATGSTSLQHPSLPPSASPPSLPPPPPRTNSLLIAAADIKLSHSIFALPFALLGAFLSASAPTLAPIPNPSPQFPAYVPIDWSRFGGQLALVIACMVLARTWAMLVNRIADATFDAANPRTRGRAVASGKLPRPAAISMAFGCAAGFIALCAGFLAFFQNPWPLALSVPVLFWLALYSYAKRFTALCHVLLGSALAISPLAAAIAINPESLSNTPSLLALSAMVLCWVAGFDIIYALQDESFDRNAGLFSIPAALGAKRAVILSRVLHVGAIISLLMAWRLEDRFGMIFLCAVIAASICLIAEHIVLIRRGLAGLPMAFFTLNGVVSCVVGGAGVVDVLL